MINIKKPLTISDVRRNADKLLEQGICFIASAINAVEDKEIPYQCSKSDIEELTAALHEVMRIVYKANITISQSKNTKLDKSYQAFRAKLFSFELDA